jgi:hypothetical protein
MVGGSSVLWEEEAQQAFFENSLLVPRPPPPPFSRQLFLGDKESSNTSVWTTPLIVVDRVMITFDCEIFY